MPQKLPVTDAQIEVIKTLKLDGKTWKACAIAAGLSTHACRKAILERGLLFPHPMVIKGVKSGNKWRKRPKGEPKPEKIAKEPVEDTRARPIPPGVSTLPPLPSLQEPVFKVNWANYRY